VAFAETKFGRIQRIGVATGTVQELVPRTPYVTNPYLPEIQTYIYDAVAPGSLIPLTGSGLAEGTEISAK
jgi:hypothetical protein